MKPISYRDICNNPLVNTFLKTGDNSLAVMGFTEHSNIHVGRVAHIAGKILLQLGFSQRDAELARIAGYIHDIGNSVNRQNHAQSGAVMAFRILLDMGMSAEETALICSAIGNHHETDGCAVSHISAALIIADKSDVRRSRVKKSLPVEGFDIHDRVNYAVKHSSLLVDAEARTISLVLAMDTSISSPMEYLEIFMERMVMSRKAAEFLSTEFRLIINGAELL